MKRTAGVVVCLCASLSAQCAETTRHIFSLQGPLTASSSRPPREIAGEYLRDVAARYQLSGSDLAGVYVWKEYRTAHNGVHHLIYRQQYKGLEVYNAEWTINIDSDGRVINAGGSLFPAPDPGGLPPDRAAAMAAVRSAVAYVNPSLAGRFVPFQSAGETAGTTLRFHRGMLGDEVEGQAVWCGVNGSLRPAWMFYIVDADGINAYTTVVDSATQTLLAKQAMTAFQNPPSGLVFVGASPQPNPNPGVALKGPPPFVSRTRQPLTGDPSLSLRGWVSGSETAGNNAVAGANPAGTRFLYPPLTAMGTGGEFNFPLELGPRAPNPILFREAATVNLFYWINRSHDLFYAIGFDEAAGNFQQENFGRGGIGLDPILAYSHFGAAAPSGAQLSNAFYTTRSVTDGSPSMIAMFLSTFGGAFGDGSYDAEVIVHEYTHGVTSRLLRGYGSHQTAAMGEAWSDFYSLEFTIPEGAPPDGVYAQGEYFSQSFGAGIRTRPYSVSTEINPLTYASLGRVLSRPQIHADGEIWMEVLWEIRANLIGQFGEREGRRRVRLLVLDALKLSPPVPSYADMRNAILLADRVSFGGASQAQLWEAFAKRGLGILAQSGSPHTTHVTASFERPSPAGSMRFYEDSYVIGETLRVVLQDSNNSQDTVRIQLTGSSGDLEDLILRKDGPVYLGSLPTFAFTPVTRGDGALSLIPADLISAYYVDGDAGGAPRLIELTVPTRPRYSVSLGLPAFQFSGERPLNLRQPFQSSRRFDLPFEFPFYGRRYSSLIVYNNGLLAFELPPSSPCTDEAALTSHVGVAPLWMELRTDGLMQPDEDVYVSTTADAVTFRWAAETDVIVPTVIPEPVNFAATLFRDGRIEFNYGEGNKNLTNAPPFAGCPVSTPTVGISPGTETFVQTVGTHSGQGDLEDAPRITFEPPFGHSSIPAGKLESPEEGAALRGVLSGSGVVYDTGASISRVDVLIDGMFRARAATGVPRRDFCAQQNVAGCPNIGFTFHLDLNGLGLAEGPHTLSLRVTNTRGAFADFPERPVNFRVEPGQSRTPFGRIEAPESGAEVSGTTQVRGYVAAGDLRIAAVDVLIDGINYGRATYGQTSRPDVCDPLSPRPPNCPRIGFSFSLNTTRASLPLSNGRHTLQVRVQDESGRLTLIPETPLTLAVNNPANQPPQGVLATPAHNDRVSGTILVYGYAWDADGRIETVQLVANGETRATVPYGEARTSECAALPDLPGCPNIGFATQFDTRRLPNGPAVLGIRLIDNRGSAVVIPTTVRDGINVFVEN